jgi:hypothetical protein
VCLKFLFFVKMFQEFTNEPQPQSNLQFSQSVIVETRVDFGPGPLDPFEELDNLLCDFLTEGKK